MGSDLAKQAPIKIAISSCLLGEPVRYDGTDKKHNILSQIPETLIQFIPICPEVAIGMGIPRPPIQLVKTITGIQAIQVDDPTKNFTEPLHAYGAKMAQHLNDICGYIFKARSPSCGISTTPIYNEANETEKGSGLYAKQIMRLNPGLPTAEETAFGTPNEAQQFFERVFAYYKQQEPANAYLIMEKKIALNTYLEVHKIKFW